MSNQAVPEKVFQEYVDARARKAQLPKDAVLSELGSEAFVEQLNGLHQEFMAGECSLGYMAEQLGITQFALIHLLDELGWPVTNL